MQAIVFDWDGTIADTLPTCTPRPRRSSQDSGSRSPGTTTAGSGRPTGGPSTARSGCPRDLIEEAGRRWWAVYRGRDEAGLLPGAADALERLHGAGFPLAIVTAGHRDNVGGQIRRHGLDELLPVRVHGDDLVEVKPHPAPLLRAIRELGLGPTAAGTAYVGDAFDDMRMARAAGAHAVGIDSVLGDERALRAAGADETAHSVAAWVDRLLGARV